MKPTVPNILKPRFSDACKVSFEVSFEASVDISIGVCSEVFLYASFCSVADSLPSRIAMRFSNSEILLSRYWNRCSSGNNSKPQKYFQCRYITIVEL